MTSLVRCCRPSKSPKVDHPSVTATKKLPLIILGVGQSLGQRPENASTFHPIPWHSTTCGKPEFVRVAVVCRLENLIEPDWSPLV